MFQQLGGIIAIVCEFPQLNRYYCNLDGARLLGTFLEKSNAVDIHMAFFMSGFLQTWFFVALFICTVLLVRLHWKTTASFSMVSLMAAVMAVHLGRLPHLPGSIQQGFRRRWGYCSNRDAVRLLTPAFNIGFQAGIP